MSKITNILIQPKYRTPWKVATHETHVNAISKFPHKNCIHYVKGLELCRLGWPPAIGYKVSSCDKNLCCAVISDKSPATVVQQPQAFFAALKVLQQLFKLNNTITLQLYNTLTLMTSKCRSIFLDLLCQWRHRWDPSTGGRWALKKLISLIGRQGTGGDRSNQERKSRR